jgi:hypothetical protein
MLRSRRDTAAVSDRISQDELGALIARPSLENVQKTEDEPQPAISNLQNAHQHRPFQCLQKTSEILVL